MRLLSACYATCPLNHQVMTINLLDTFRENILEYNKNENLSKIGLSSLEQTITTLKNFFDTKNFIFNDSEGYNSFEAQRNYIQYNIFQSRGSIGCAQNILELAAVIYYFSSNAKDIELVSKKLKKKKSQINSNQLKNNLFELYLSIILENSGIRVKIDDNDKFRQLDITTYFNGKNVVFECKSLDLSAIEEAVVKLTSFLFFNHNKLIHKKIDYKDIYKLSNIIVIFSEKFDHIEIAVNKSIEIIKNYFKNKHLSNTTSLIINPFVPLIGEAKMVIEPFDSKIAEYYAELFKGKGYYIRYSSILFEGKNIPQLILDIQVNYEKKDINTRILDSIKDKQDQHKSTTYDHLVIAIEYENIYGIRERVSIDNLNIEAIKKRLKANQICLFIVKDNEGDKLLKRESVVISHIPNDPLVRMLSDLNYERLIIHN